MREFIILMSIVIVFSLLFGWMRDDTPRYSGDVPMDFMENSIF